MPRSLLLAFLLLAGCAAATAGGRRGGQGHWTRKGKTVEPYCYPYNYTCGPIAPSPPSSYEAHLEQADLIKKSTHYIEEFYDYESNILAVTDAFGDSLMHAILYFDINTAVLMSTDRATGPSDYHPTVCSVAEITSSSVYYPLPGVDGTPHLVIAPSQAMLFGDNFKYSYVDNGTEREMEYNRWDACITTETESFYMEYYWTDPELVDDMNGYTSERPIKMRMTGHAQPLPGTSDMVQIDSVYSVALFDANPNLEDIRWAFEIPSGVYCQDFPSVKDPPYFLDRSFSMTVEVTSRVDIDYSAGYERGTEVMLTVRMWYDFYNELTRMDSMAQVGTPEFEVAGLTQVAVISDYRAGVEYVIDKTLGNCTTINITGNTFTVTAPDGHHSIKDPIQLFGIEGTNLTYQGMKYARGLPCDVWVGHMGYADIDSYTYELYFLQSGWTEDAGEHSKNLPVPVLIKAHNIFSYETVTFYTNLEQSIFKYEENDPDMTVYDITPCFTGHDHIRRFQMAFSSDYREDFERDPTFFTNEITGGLLIYLEIPSIRLQHPLVEYVEDFNHLYYEFTLLDQPQVDMEFPLYVGKPLDEVVENLKQSMDHIVIVITDDQEHPKLMRPIADSLRELFEEGCYSRNIPNPQPATAIPLVTNNQQPATGTPLVTSNQQPATGIPLVTSNQQPATGTPLVTSNQQPATGIPHVTSNDHPETTTTEGRKEDDITGSVFAFFKEIQHWMRGSHRTQGSHGTRGSDEKIYTPGAMAGMAVGMLVLGLLLGTVVTMVILRKLGLSNDLEYIPMNSRRH